MNDLTSRTKNRCIVVLEDINLEKLQLMQRPISLNKPWLCFVNVNTYQHKWREVFNQIYPQKTSVDFAQCFIMQLQAVKNKNVTQIIQLLLQLVYKTQRQNEYIPVQQLISELKKDKQMYLLTTDQIFNYLKSVMYAETTIGKMQLLRRQGDSICFCGDYQQLDKILEFIEGVQKENRS